MKKIFVYGTLKTGGANHRFLQGQKRIKSARTVTGYVMYDVGGYPGLLQSPDSPGYITGEIWAVDSQALTALDEFEGVHEGLYERRSITIACHESEEIDAYFYLRSVEGLREIGPDWPIR